MKKTVLILTFFLSSLLFASNKHEHDHGHNHKHDHEQNTTSLGKHVHGELECSIAVDQAEVFLELKSPAESLIGFEHRPQTKKEKKKWMDFSSSWKEGLLGSFNIVETKCEIADPIVMLNVDEKGSHAQIHAEALIKCPTNLHGKKIMVSLGKTFPAVKKVHFEVLPAKSAPYKKSAHEDQKTLELEL